MGRRALPKVDPKLDISQHYRELDDLIPRDLRRSSVPAESAEPADTKSEPGEQPKFPITSLFSASAPLEIEIGSGKGLFLSSAAQQRPDHNFLGIELARKYARFAASKLAKLDLPNAVMLQGDGLLLLHELVATESVHAVHVYFPDPWWKKRHKKRRVMNEGCLNDIERVLEPGGALHFWTDVEEYFQTTLELISAVTKLVGPLSVAEREASHHLDYQTHFERRMRLHNLPVYRSEFRKRN